MENKITNNKTIGAFVDKTISKILEKASSNIRQAIQNRVIEYTTENAKKCSYLRTILHKENIPIDKIYFPLKLSDSNGHIIIPKTVKDLFSKNSRIIIQGKGGSGKTTFIKYFYINSVSINYKIPILFNLRDFNIFDISEIRKRKEKNSNLFLEELTKLLLFNRVGISAEIIDEMFQSGKFLFILDGYDELQYDVKQYILKDLEDFVSRFPDNKYVITTRPYTDATRLTTFHSYEINGLDENGEIPEFVARQLFNNEDLASSIVQTLADSSSSRYLQMLSNPLFLILFINSFESYPKLPPKKSDFYWQVFDALYEKHETFSKSGYKRPRICQLKREDFELVLNALSFVSYFQGQFSFKNIYLESILRKIGKTYKISFAPSEFGEDLKVTLSLVVEEGDQLLFIHRTLQEFFASRFLNILNTKDKQKFFGNLIDKQLKDTGHTFLLELISELYPHEYSEYYLPIHIKKFFERFDMAFTSDRANIDEMVTCFKFFQNLEELIDYSEDIQIVVDWIVKHNSNNYNKSHRFFSTGIGKERIQTVTKMIILFRNREQLFEKINERFKNISETNKPFIDFALFS